MVDIAVVGFVGEHHQHHIAQGGVFGQATVVPGNGWCGDVGRYSVWLCTASSSKYPTTRYAVRRDTGWSAK